MSSASSCHCNACGKALLPQQVVCGDCTAPQPPLKYRSRAAAATLAVFAGMLGAHRFFLGQWWGVFYLLFCWTGLPWLVSMVEGLVFLSTSQERWNNKYNNGFSPGAESTIVVWIFALILPLITLLGIAAAIAIPAYQGYLMRAQM